MLNGGSPSVAFRAGVVFSLLSLGMLTALWVTGLVI